nr:MAG TPA: hypothetical protein [Caudoviricetes sp.]
MLFNCYHFSFHFHFLAFGLCLCCCFVVYGYIILTNGNFVNTFLLPLVTFFLDFEFLLIYNVTRKAVNRCLTEKESLI